MGFPVKRPASPRCRRASRSSTGASIRCVSRSNPALLRDPTELAIKKLDEQVERAVEAQRQHDELSRKLADARTHLESLDERRNQHESARARLFALADATTEAEFVEVVSRAEKVV